VQNQVPKLPAWYMEIPPQFLRFLVVSSSFPRRFLVVSSSFPRRFLVSVTPGRDGSVLVVGKGFGESLF
jgi:hypothetical protein